MDKQGKKFRLKIDVMLFIIAEILAQRNHKDLKKTLQTEESNLNNATSRSIKDLNDTAYCSKYFSSWSPDITLNKNSLGRYVSLIR